MKRRILTIGAALLFIGCAGGVKGTYVGGDDSFLRSMTFKDEGKVDVVLINGIGGEGTYEVDGDKVRVSANGQTNELTIGSDDCLHGPLMMGTLCKGGQQPSASASSSAPKTRTGGGLSGSTFTATAEGGGMSLQFVDGQSVKLSTFFSGAPEGTGAILGTYTTSGNQVTISIQGDPETFTFTGNTLTGTLSGDPVTFKRK